jgi:hypothetical protein
MAGDSNVPITAGSGTTVDTYQLTGGDHQQVVREAPASAAAAPATWTLATTGANGGGTGVVAADLSRRWLCFTNNSSTAWVYIRFDTTAPASTAIGNWHFALAPGAVYVVEKEMVCLPVSLIASAVDAANPLSISYATAALWASRFQGSSAGSSPPRPRSGSPRGYPGRPTRATWCSRTAGSTSRTEAKT